MKYHRFNRWGRYDMSAVHTYYKSWKKQQYMVNTGRSKMLNSGFFENQVWGALHKAWKGYTIAKNKDEYGKMVHYARIIQESQHDLGRKVSSFPNIGMLATSFLSEIAQEENNIQKQEASDEEYQTAQYEQERFTDTYSEYFEDDENKAERFTDDYRENFTD
jgi:hypothetical protein